MVPLSGILEADLIVFIIDVLDMVLESFEGLSTGGFLVERGDDMSEGEFRAPMEAVMTVDIGGDSNEGV